jgi:major vault protein
LCDPWNNENNSNDLGKKTIKIGEDAFFIKPGEYLEEGIQDVMVLSEEDSLLLKATQSYTDKEGNKKKPGEKWLVTGPSDFIKPIEVEILENLKAIPLDENEGV